LLKGGKVLASGASAQVVNRERLASAFGVVADVRQLDDVPIVLAKHALT
jgi:ABC-type cobalamin transport system ATPase subunit